jgi:hypothetical protein
MKIKESRVQRLGKSVKTGLGEWEVTYEGVMVGKIEKRVYDVMYKAYRLDGSYIGSATSGKQAREFITYEHVGMDNIEFKEGN